MGQATKTRYRPPTLMAWWATKNRYRPPTLMAWWATKTRYPPYIHWGRQQKPVTGPLQN